MFKRTGLLLCCVLLLLVSWAAVLGMKTPLEKQTALIALAEAQMKKGTYANAQPYLEQAVSYNTKNTRSALEMLKDVYLALDYIREYESIMGILASRDDCTAEVFGEYARYQVNRGSLAESLAVLRRGIEKTGDGALTDLYEELRYAFSYGSNIYDDVTEFQYGMIQVRSGDYWGLADSNSKIVIPCAYDAVSTLDAANNGCAVALKDGKVVTLNRRAQIIANGDMTVSEIGNLSQNMIPLRIPGGKWILANSALLSNNAEYDDLGMVFDSAVAMKKSDKWGVVSVDGKTIVPFEYDEIIMDELGRCYAQGAVFARKGDTVSLFVGGKLQPVSYEGARPFPYQGWAAVKTGGKWGYIDVTGAVRIQPQYDDALSFGGRLAPVKLGELWGYAAPSGKVVIEPQFLMAKSFYGRSAPVLTERGYFFLMLVETL